MIKWLFSFLAFMILAVSISAITMNVFISEVDSSFENAKKSALQQNDVLAEQMTEDMYEKIEPSQMQMILQIESMPKEVREAALRPQCANSEMKEQFFCDERFITGELSFDAIVKEGINSEIDKATSQSMDLMHEKLMIYKKYNLILIGIVCILVSFLMYFLLAGFAGVGKFFGSAVWISVFSAISFKLMPSMINNLVSVATQGVQEATIAKTLMSQMVAEWLVPAMNSAFIASVWIAVICFVVWLVLKLFSQNEISVN